MAHKKEGWKAGNFPLMLIYCVLTKIVFDVSEENLFRGCEYYENWYGFYGREVHMNSYQGCFYVFCYYLIYLLHIQFDCSSEDLAMKIM